MSMPIKHGVRPDNMRNTGAKTSFQGYDTHSVGEDDICH